MQNNSNDQQTKNTPTDAELDKIHMTTITGSDGHTFTIRYTRRAISRLIRSLLYGEENQGYNNKNE